MTIRCIDQDSDIDDSKELIKVNHQDLEMIRKMNESESISVSQKSIVQNTVENKAEQS